MSAPTVNLGELPPSPTNQADDLVLEDLLEEAKKHIRYLPKDEQAWLDKARTSQGTPPEAANAADDQLEHGTLLANLTMFDNKSIAEIITEITKAGPDAVFETINERNAQGIETPVNPATMDSVRAANDNWGGSETYSVFESDVMKDIVQEYALHIHTKSDTDGKRFFYFDNGVNISITVVVFDMKGIRMIKLNNTILSLDTLLSLKRCVALPDAEEKREGVILRRTPAFQGGVACIFEDEVSINIPNISVDSLMVIISHLSQVYACSAVLDTKEVRVPEKIPSNTDDDITVAISHGVVSAIGMLIGVLIGKFAI